MPSNDETGCGDATERVPEYSWWPDGVPISDVRDHDCRYCMELHGRLIALEDVGVSVDGRNATLDSFPRASA